MKKGPEGTIIGIAEVREMVPMVKIKGCAKPRDYKRLNAQEVHRLVSEVLQEHFPLAMEGRTYEAQDIWDVLIAVAA